MRKKKVKTPRIDFGKVTQRKKYFDKDLADNLDKTMEEAYNMIQIKKTKLDSLSLTFAITS